jgi:hypothetical protein
MPHDVRVQRALSRVARATRHPDNIDPDEVAAARTALNEAKVQAWVERTLADAPPHLTPQTKAKLARLLAGDAK